MSTRNLDEDSQKRINFKNIQKKNFVEILNKISGKLEKKKIKVKRKS